MKADPEAYALLCAFVKRRALRVKSTTEHQYHSNLFVTDGADIVPVAIYNTGAITVQHSDNSPLRSVLVAFLDAVGAKKGRVYA
jgi:hypothetical protein